MNVVTPNPLVNPFFSQPYVSGMIFGGRLATTQTITNLTAANNTIVNNQDDQMSVAGFIGSLTNDSADMKFINTTIVNNSATQSNPGTFQQAFISGGTNATFFVDKVDPFAPDITNGASAQNSLVAGNSRNGINGSCIQGDKSALTLSGTVDLTPLDAGNNITDDPSCTGYSVNANIMSTLGPLQNNGGPVETIALLDGSPAINAGVQVLGISVDARGVARPSSNPSVGAYQYVSDVVPTVPVTMATTVPVNSVSGSGGSLPETGLSNVNLVYLATVLLASGILLAYKARRKMSLIFKM